MSTPEAYDGRCLVCGGRGSFPTSYLHDWVPNTACQRCAGTGTDPHAELFTQLLAP